MKNYSSIINNSNQTKHIVLYQLLLDNKITEEDYLEYYNNWGIIVINKGWFKNWFNKFRSKLTEKNPEILKFIRLTTTIDFAKDKSEIDIDDLDYSSLTKNELNKYLDIAVSNENFAAAIQIRNELKKR